MNMVARGEESEDWGASKAGQEAARRAVARQAAPENQYATNCTSEGIYLGYPEAFVVRMGLTRPSRLVAGHGAPFIPAR